MSRANLFFLVSASLVCAAADGAPESPSSTHGLKIGSFMLKDQRGRRHEQTFPKKRVSIYALADRKGSDQLEDWITPLYKQYEDRVDLCGVANLKGVPKFMRPMIRGMFRKGVDYPVMMDWSGETCEAFGYRANAADIFVVAPNGVLIHRVSGGVTEEKLKGCFQVIDGQLKKAAEGEAGAGAAKADGQPSEKPPPARESTSGAPAPES